MRRKGGITLDHRGEWIYVSLDPQADIERLLEPFGTADDLVGALADHRLGSEVKGPFCACPGKIHRDDNGNTQGDAKDSEPQLPGVMEQKAVASAPEGRVHF